MIEQYLSPEAKFTFYLDAPQHDATCRVMVNYGDREFDCMDQYQKTFAELEGIRLNSREQEILLNVQKMFPSVDIDRGLFSCGGDEESRG